MLSPLETLHDVITNEHFPEADMQLRRGVHISSEDGMLYGYLQDALEHLEPFYRRFGAELIHRSDGYFYLLPRGGGLRAQVLDSAEMLVGQVMALFYLDPSTLANSGAVQVDILLEWFTGMLGEETAVMMLNPKRRKYRETTASRDARKGLFKALRSLERLGFLSFQKNTETVYARAPLMRFADPVRDFGDSADALRRLIEHGEVVVNDDDEDIVDVRGERSQEEE